MRLGRSVSLADIIQGLKVLQVAFHTRPIYQLPGMPQHWIKALASSMKIGCNAVMKGLGNDQAHTALVESIDDQVSDYGWAKVSHLLWLVGCHLFPCTFKVSIWYPGSSAAALDMASSSMVTQPFSLNVVIVAIHTLRRANHPLAPCSPC